MTADLDLGRDAGPVVVFGGTGFLGRRIVRHLARRGLGVVAASRHPERAAALFPPTEPRVQAVRVDIADEVSVAGVLAGASAAVNAVSLYVERGGLTFGAIHVDAARRVARLAREAAVKRAVHISGVGSDPGSPSSYVAARGHGEAAIREADPDMILVRPTVMVGPDDAFLTTMVGLLRRLPAYPLFGAGRTLLQPVHVENVAEAVARLVSGDPPPPVSGPAGRLWEFGGPRTYSYEDLVRSVAERIRVRPRLLPLPFGFWQGVARIGEILPQPPLTRDQVALMRHDNVLSGRHPGLAELGVTPTAIEEVAAEIAAGIGTGGRH